MMTEIVLLAFLTIICALFGAIIFDDDDSVSSTIGVILSVASLVLFVGVIYSSIEYGENKDISAIEVYRGNTTLEITYRDGIAIDTLVVMK